MAAVSNALISLSITCFPTKCKLCEDENLTSSRSQNGTWEAWNPSPHCSSEVASHLSLHAADPDQLIEDQQGSMDPVIPIHALLLGQGLIKPFLCFFKCVLQRDAEYFHYTTPRVRKQLTHLRGGSEVTMPAEGLVPVSSTILAQ